MLSFLALLPLDFLKKNSSVIWKIVAVLVVVASVWGHGYYTANNKWTVWYEGEKTRQETINKDFYNRGKQEAELLKKEEQKDEQKLQQLEKEADSDSTAGSIVLPRSSVQRLNKL